MSSQTVVRSGHTPTRGRPMHSLLAAARRLTSKTVDRAHAEGWQEEAWGFYDDVGELWFVANTFASAASRANLYVGMESDDPGEPPQPVGAGTASDVLRALGGGTDVGLTQLQRRMALHLFVAGEDYLVGLPPHHLDPDVDEPDDDVPMQELDWRALSTSEVSTSRASDTVTLRIGEGPDEEVDVGVDEVLLIRTWDPHPNRWWQADSPVKASRHALREIMSLTKHIAATADSRLAGAGLLVVGESAEVSISQQIPQEDGGDEDPFVASLIEAMTTPIAEPDSASAVVPLVVTVPDETVDKIQHITFDVEMDEAASENRDTAIRRLALGLDTPPEVLLGLSDVNHWNAWAIDDDTIKLHIEPVLQLICSNLTSEYLRPVLQEAGLPDADRTVVWYDVAPLRGDDEGPGEDLAVQMALDLVRDAPTLAETPGISALVEEIRQVIAESSDVGDRPEGPPSPEPPEEPSMPDPAGNGGVPA